MTVTTANRVDAAHRYARDVLDGHIVAGRLVRLACERHLRDLETGHERGLRFSEDAADHIIAFIEHFLRFPDGVRAGHPFILEPFQLFIVASLFGWQRWDDADRVWYRRFRVAYIEMGKGSGKSPLAGAIGIYGLVADGEIGAQIYSAATQREQAAILFHDAKRMVEASPDLLEVITVMEHSLLIVETNGVFRPLSSENKGLDGKRIHMALVDELHEHPNGLVVGKLDAGTKAARNALIVEITNSGYDRESICWQHHAYSEAVLEGRSVNDSWFAYVCGLDKNDDWRDPTTWIKANPGIDRILPRRYLEEQVRRAIDLPAEQLLITRLCFCVWTESSVRWMPLDVWDACAGPVPWHQLPDHLRGRRCFAGLDLANTSDLAALALVFPDYRGDEPCYDVMIYAWCPEETVRERSRRTGVPYDVWAREGALITTPGNVIDYKAILKTVQQAVVDYHVLDLGYDRWGSTKLVQDLEEIGFHADSRHYPDRRLTPLGQGYATMTSPTKELEVLIKSGRIRHGNHPVLRWAISNLVVEQDPAGNLKPSKEKSSEKIDPAVAMIMGVERATRDQGESVYERRGVLSI